LREITAKCTISYRVKIYHKSKIWSTVIV
jgi:hypothetical protein